MKKHVPSQFWEFQDVFSEIESECMPVRKPWDHKIDLRPDFMPKKGRVIPLSDVEQEELKKFVDMQLAEGYIHPSISEQTSPVFFIPQKDGGQCLIQDYCHLNSGMVKNNYP